MTVEGVFGALALAAQCDGPGALPCPEAMIMWNGQEASLCVEPQAYLALCERRWTHGHYYPAVARALRFCTDNELPLPAWLADVVNPALLIAFQHGGRTNRRTGSYEKQARQYEKHERRWAIVKGYKMFRGITDDEAFERASRDLRGTEAACEPRQVEYSYRKIQRLLKAGTAILAK